MTDIHRILKQYWNYDAFRPLQEEIVRAVLAGHDTLALLPTGGGKSICFQVPALAQEGICLVVSPLIALMKDQVENLNRRGIPAAAIFAGMSRREIDITLDNCIYGNIKFLYLSPERLQTELFQARVQKMNVSLLAVDEAHCISQWGYDFRPPYLQIAALRELLQEQVPVIALTATATPAVQQDIQEKLLFRKGKHFQQSFARKNLSYSVLETEDKNGRLVQILQKMPGTAIVYVRSRKQTVEVAKMLQQRRIPAAAYHAGMSMKERNQVQQSWLDNRTRVMVATNAFGMGIDKPDVRVVVHLDLPETLEAYYQEAGRAGRDGKYAYAVILLGPSDAKDLIDKVEEAHPPPDVLRRVYQSLANYFQIAVGSGAFSSFSFNFDDFVRTYKHEALETHHALRQLESEGFIQLNEAYYSPSRIFIPVENEELYKFQVANRKFDPLIQAVLRVYGGEVFTNFVKISEKTLASMLNTAEDLVKKALQYLSKAGIMAYEPQTDAPQLVFTQARLDAATLPLDAAKLNRFRENALQKARAVQQYVDAEDRCRTALLLQYFGEMYSQRCRICDYCLAERKQHEQEKQAQQLQEKIYAQLRKQELPPKQLLAYFEPQEARAVTETIRRLLDLGRLRYRENGSLAVVD